MIGVGIAFIVIGIVFLFVIPWVGIVAGIVALALAIICVPVSGAVQSVATSTRSGTASEAHHVC